MDTCPEPDRIALWLADELDGPESGRFEVHVEGCTSCQAQLERMTGGAQVVADDREILERLRRLAPRPDPSSPRGGPTSAPGLPSIAGFRLLREVGRGGMGTVYEAVELALGRTVALKVVPRSDVGSSNSVHRFRREARAAAGLHHTNIVPVFGVGEDAGFLYYAMQYIAGEGLDRLYERLRHRKLGGSRISFPPPTRDESAGIDRSAWSVDSSPTLDAEITPTEADRKWNLVEPTEAGASRARVSPPPSSFSSSSVARGQFREIAGVGLQVAEALQFAHGQSILHRDIKPANILIDHAGTAWVTDFGLAKSVEGEHEGLTRTGDILGTLRYMAPERFEGRSDARGDVYALGATLYELLTLRPVFEESNRAKLIEKVLREGPPRPRSVDPRIPRDLETIVLKAMSKEATGRYATAGALAEDLRRFLAGEPIRARRSGRVERAWRSARRNPVVAGLAATAFLAISVGLAATSWKWREAAAQTVRAVGAEKATGRERDRAIEARSEARRLAADMTLERGLGLLERGESESGRLWLARAVEMPEIDPESRRVALLNMATWDDASPRLSQVIAGPSKISAFGLAADGATLHAVTAPDRMLRHFNLETGAEVGSPSLVPWVGTSPECTQYFLPGGHTLLVIGGHRHEFLLVDAASGASRGGPHAIIDDALEIQLDPLGKVLIARISASKCRAWDVSTGEPVGPEIESPGAFALSPGGLRVFASGPSWGRIHDLAADRVIATLPGPPDRLSFVGYSPTGTIVTVEVTPPHPGEKSTTRTLRVLGGDDGKPRGAVLGLPDWPGYRSFYGFGPDGDTLAMIDQNQQIDIFDLRAGSRREGASAGGGGLVSDLTYSPDGSIAFVNTLGGKVRLCDGRTGRYRGVSLAGGNSTAVSNDGRSLAILLDGEVRLWRLPDRPLPMLSEGREPVETDDIPHPVAFMPSSVRGMVPGDEGEFRLATSAAPSSLPPSTLPWKAFGLSTSSPDGRRWAVSARDHQTVASRLRLLDADGSTIGGDLPHTNWLVDLAFSPDGKHLAATGYGSGAMIYNANDGRPETGLFLGYLGMSVAFSSDGATLAVGTGPGLEPNQLPQIQLWDARPDVMDEPRREPRRSIVGDGWTTFLAFSPDGRTLVTRSGSRLGRRTPSICRLRDAKTLEPRGEPLSYPANDPRAIAFLPGDRLLTEGPGGVWEWDVKAGTPRRLAISLSHGLIGLAADPSSRWLAALTADGKGYLFDSATYRPVGPPRRAERPIVRLDFAGDGRTLVAILDNATTRSWELPKEGDVAEASFTSESLALATGAALDPASGGVLTLSGADWRSRASKLPPASPGESGEDEGRRHASMAAAAEAEGNTFAALWHLDRLARLRPGDWSIEARRSRLLALSDREEEAASALSRADRLAPAGAMTGWRIARAAEDRDAGRVGLALKRLDEVLANAPSDVTAILMRAKLLRADGRRAAADADFDRAALLGSDDPDALERLELMARRGEWSRASAALKAARGRRAWYPWQLSYKGAIADLSAGDPASYREECARLLQRLRRRDPTLPVIRACHILTLGPSGLDDYSDPLRTMRTLVKAAPSGQETTRHALLGILGALAIRSGRPAEAIPLTREGIAADRGKAVTADHLFLALAYHATGDARAARDAFKRSIGAIVDDPWRRAELNLLGREIQENPDAPRPELPAEVFARPRRP